MKGCLSACPPEGEEWDGRRGRDRASGAQTGGQALNFNELDIWRETNYETTIMSSGNEPLGALMDQVVVIDLTSPYVVLGKLVGADPLHLELRDADVHDLRDSTSTREMYVAESIASGVKVNRRRVLISASQVVSIAALNDFIS